MISKIIGIVLVGFTAGILAKVLTASEFEHPADTSYFNTGMAITGLVALGLVVWTFVKYPAAFGFAAIGEIVVGTVIAGVVSMSSSPEIRIKLAAGWIFLTPIGVILAV